MFDELHVRAQKAGLPPGTPIYTGGQTTVIPKITVTHYDPRDCQVNTGHCLEDCLPKDIESGITWVHIAGLDDPALIGQLAKNYKLHPLTVEDILNVEQRSKVEDFSEYYFITLKMLRWDSQLNIPCATQLSIVFSENFVLSFVESESFIFDSIRQRLQSSINQRLRQQGSDYLVYRMIDVIVDQYFVVLEKLSDQIEKVEDNVITNPQQGHSQTLYHLKREVLLLRKAIWPMREVINHLMQMEGKWIRPFTLVYLRDVYDHTIQAIDTLESFREMIMGVLDVYLLNLTNKMNEIMKTLTIIATIFIPITCIASIYGMNFKYMPELNWRWGYPVALGVMAFIGVLMLAIFRRRKWL